MAREKDRLIVHDSVERRHGVWAFWEDQCDNYLFCAWIFAITLGIALGVTLVNIVPMEKKVLALFGSPFLVVALIALSIVFRPFTYFCLFGFGMIFCGGPALLLLWLFEGPCENPIWVKHVVGLVVGLGVSTLLIRLYRDARMNRIWASRPDRSSGQWI